MSFNLNHHQGYLYDSEINSLVYRAKQEYSPGLINFPDQFLKSRNISRQNFSIGHRALSMLKQLTGITLYRSNKNFKDKWKKFSKDQQGRNASRNSGEY